MSKYSENDKKKVHNIVASVEFASVMRYVENNYMISIRGYLRRREEDNILFQKAEQAARDAIEKVLLEED